MILTYSFKVVRVKKKNQESVLINYKLDSKITLILDQLNFVLNNQSISSHIRQ